MIKDEVLKIITNMEDDISLDKVMYQNGYALDSTKKIMHNVKYDERISYDF